MQLVVNEERKMCLNVLRQSGVESSAKYTVYVFLDLLLPLGYLEFHLLFDFVKCQHWGIFLSWVLKLRVSLIFWKRN